MFCGWNASFCMLAIAVGHCYFPFDWLNRIFKRCRLYFPNRTLCMRHNELIVNAKNFRHLCLMKFDVNLIMKWVLWWRVHFSQSSFYSTHFHLKWKFHNKRIVRVFQLTKQRSICFKFALSIYILHTKFSMQNVGDVGVNWIVLVERWDSEAGQRASFGLLALLQLK